MIQLLGEHPAVFAALITAWASLVGVCSSSLMKYFLDRRSQRITLVLKTRNNANCLVLTQGSKLPDGISRNFVRIEVYNKSPHNCVAKQVDVRLLSVAQTTSGNKKLFRNPNPKSLPWNEENYPEHKPRDLPHGGPYFVDLFVVGETTPITAHVSNHSLDSDFIFSNNSYSFVVQATAEGARSVTKKINVSIGSSIDDVRFAFH